MSQEELNAQAKTLLSAAGYGPQKPLKLTLLYNTSENHQKIAIAVASMWKKNLGVDVKLQNQEWKTYIDSRNTGNFDVIRASWVGDYNEPSTFLTLLTSTHSGNISRFNNPAYDKVLAQASTEIPLKRVMPITTRQKNPRGASTDCTNLSIYQWTINQAVAERLSH